MHTITQTTINRYKTVSNLKVLPLCYWQKERTNSLFKKHREETLKRYKEIPPYYNRPGIYKLNNISWFELENGKAYKYKIKDFDIEHLILTFSEYDSYYLEELLKVINKFKNVITINKEFNKNSISFKTAIYIALDKRSMEFRLSRYKLFKKIRRNIKLRIDHDNCR